MNQSPLSQERDVNTFVAQLSSCLEDSSTFDMLNNATIYWLCGHVCNTCECDCCPICRGKDALELPLEEPVLRELSGYFEEDETSVDVTLKEGRRDELLSSVEGYLRCPLSLEYMKKPIIAYTCGHSIESRDKSLLPESCPHMRCDATRLQKNGETLEINNFGLKDICDAYEALRYQSFADIVDEKALASVGAGIAMHFVPGQINMHLLPFEELINNLSMLAEANLALFKQVLIQLQNKMHPLHTKVLVGQFVTKLMANGKRFAPLRFSKQSILHILIDVFPWLKHSTLPHQNILGYCLLWKDWQEVGISLLNDVEFRYDHALFGTLRYRLKLLPEQDLLALINRAPKLLYLICSGENKLPANCIFNLITTNLNSQFFSAAEFDISYILGHEEIVALIKEQSHDSLQVQNVAQFLIKLSMAENSGERTLERMKTFFQNVLNQKIRDAVLTQIDKCLPQQLPQTQKFWHLMYDLYLHNNFSVDLERLPISSLVAVIKFRALSPSMWEELLRASQIDSILLQAVEDTEVFYKLLNAGIFKKLSDKQIRFILSKLSINVVNEEKLEIILLQQLQAESLMCQRHDGSKSVSENLFDFLRVINVPKQAVLNLRNEFWQTVLQQVQDIPRVLQGVVSYFTQDDDPDQAIQRLFRIAMSCAIQDKTALLFSIENCIQNQEIKDQFTRHVASQLQPAEKIRWLTELHSYPACKQVLMIIAQVPTVEVDQGSDAKVKLIYLLNFCEQLANGVVPELEIDPQSFNRGRVDSALEILQQRGVVDAERRDDIQRLIDEMRVFDPKTSPIRNLNHSRFIQNLRYQFSERLQNRRGHSRWYANRWRRKVRYMEFSQFKSDVVGSARLQLNDLFNSVENLALFNKHRFAFRRNQGRPTATAKRIERLREQHLVL